MSPASAGVAWAREAARRGLPLRVLLQAPSCVPSAPGLEMAGAEFGPAEIAEILSWPEVAGLAEVMDMAAVISGEPRMAAILAAAAASGKRINGHARGLHGAALQAFCAAGITSDHEITSGEDLLEKLRAGLTVELRGSHDDILPGAVAALGTLPLLPPTLVICTDDVLPDDLLAKGGMRDVLARLIARGLPPVAAIRCATLHAALRLGRTDIGLIAPGRFADIAVLRDLGSVEVEGCLAAGRLVAWEGKTRAPLPPPPPGCGTRRETTRRCRPGGSSTLRVRGVAEGEVELPLVRGTRFTLSVRRALRCAAAWQRCRRACVAAGGGAPPRARRSGRRRSASSTAGANCAGRSPPPWRTTATTCWCSAASQPTWQRRHRR